MKIVQLLACVALIAPLGVACAAEGDAAIVQNKIWLCKGCHGVAGYHTAFPRVYHVPKLGGQNATYIENVLHEYQDGQRTHPSMDAIAAQLSDKDIAALAAYFSAQPEGKK